MSVRPVVDGIERDLADHLEVIRLNLQEPAGRQLAAAYGARFTPTFVLLNADGDEIWRSVYRLDRATIAEALGLP